MADALEAGGDVKRAEKLRACSTDVVVLACKNGHGHAVPAGCDDRFCPDCAPSLSVRAKAQARQATDVARRKGLRTAHIVFTVPNVARMTSTVLQELHRNVWRWTRHVYIKTHVAGLYRVTECTGGAGDWHPHVHGVVALDAESREDYGRLWRMMAMHWHGLTGCSRTCPAKLGSFTPGAPGCDRGGSVKLCDILGPQDDQGPILNQVGKYITKGLQAEATPDITQLSHAINRLRARQGYGVFRGIGKGKPDPHQCGRCCTHNESVMAVFGTEQTTPANPHLLDPDAGYVETGVKRAGSLRSLWIRAARGDAWSRRILRYLKADTPELWGEKEDGHEQRSR